MTDAVVGLLPVFAYFATVLAAGPVTLAAFAVALRVRPFARALGWVTASLAVLVGVGTLALAVLVAPEAAVTVALTALVAGVVLGAIPVLVARTVVAREDTVSPNAALRYALAGWPVALVISAGVFVAPGSLARYNITFLTGPAAVLAWSAFALVVLLGPTAVAIALVRWRRPQPGRTGTA